MNELMNQNCKILSGNYFFQLPHRIAYMMNKHELLLICIWMKECSLFSNLIHYTCRISIDYIRYRRSTVNDVIESCSQFKQLILNGMIRIS